MGTPPTGRWTCCLQHLLRARHRRHPGRPRRTRSSATTAATTIAIGATSTTTLRPPLARAGGFRTYRHSKASREDLPRIVIGWPSPPAGSTTGGRQSRAIAAVRGMCGCSRSSRRRLSTHPLASEEREEKVVGSFTLGPRALHQVPLPAHPHGLEHPDRGRVAGIARGRHAVLAELTEQVAQEQ